MKYLLMFFLVGLSCVFPTALLAASSAAPKASGVKSLLLSHTAPDVESREASVRASIRANYSGPVAFATDRMRVLLGGRGSAGPIKGKTSG
jgi:hypothetical protein